MKILGKIITESLDSSLNILRNLIKEKDLKINNPITFPNVKKSISLRRSPCGRGSGTLNNYKILRRKHIYFITSYASLDDFLAILAQFKDISYKIKLN